MADNQEDFSYEKVTIGEKFPKETIAKIWMHGKLVEWKEAKVHVLTHTLHYGSAVFEGIRCYETSKGPAIFRLKEHNERLFYSAEALQMEIPFSKKELFDATKEVVKENNLKSCYIRPLVYLGYGPVDVNPLVIPVKVSIAAWPWKDYMGEKGIKNGISLKTSSVPRDFLNSDLASAKISGQYVNPSLSKRESVNQGYDESLMLDSKGNVSECSSENIFIVKGNMLKTPSIGTILPGITRDSIMKIAKDLGHEVKEENLKKEDIYESDECFLTGTLAEITPVTSLDKKPITRKIHGHSTWKRREI